MAWIGAVISVVGSVASRALAGSTAPNPPSFPKVATFNPQKIAGQANTAGEMQKAATYGLASQMNPELYGPQGANTWIQNELNAQSKGLTANEAAKVHAAGLDTPTGVNDPYELDRQLGLKIGSREGDISHNISNQLALNPQVLTHLSGPQLASAIASSVGNQNALSFQRSALATAGAVNQAAQQGNMIGGALGGLAGGIGLLGQAHAQYGSPYLNLSTFQQGNAYQAGPYNPYNDQSYSYGVPSQVYGSGYSDQGNYGTGYNDYSEPPSDVAPVIY